MFVCDFKFVERLSLLNVLYFCIDFRGDSYEV